MKVLLRTIGLHKLRIKHLGKEDRRASWLELFFDLVFVVCVSQVGLQLFNNLTLDGLGHFIVLFIPILWCWSGATNFASRFEISEFANRIITGIEIMAVAWLALEVHRAFDNTHQGFILAYLVTRLLLILKYQLAGMLNEDYRQPCFRVAHGFLLGLVPIIVSLFVPHPLRYLLWLLACGLDLAIIMTSNRHLNQNLPHLSHMPERYGLFFLIILGESVTGVVNGLSQPLSGLLSMGSAMNALMGIILAFSFWWLYFDELNDTAIRRAYEYRDMRTLQLWILSHCPLAIGLTACSAVVKKLLLWPEAMTLPSLWVSILFSSVGLALIGLGAVHLTSLCVECEELNSSLWIQHLTSGLILVVLGVLSGLQWLPPMHAWTVMAIVSGICVFQVLYEEIEYALSKQHQTPNDELDPSASTLQDGFELAES